MGYGSTTSKNKEANTCVLYTFRNKMLVWGMAQVIDNLPSKQQALNSSPSTSIKSETNPSTPRLPSHSPLLRIPVQWFVLCVIAYVSFTFCISSPPRYMAQFGICGSISFFQEQDFLACLF
jgi:hypothetical protein